MVLTLIHNSKQIEISNADVKLYSGIEEIEIDSNLKIDYDKLNSKLIWNLKNSPDKIKFNNKKIYNHIKFYSFFGINLTIKLEQIKNNKYQTKIYYKNNPIHTCKKTIEAYFNYLVFTNLEAYPEFNYLFYSDDGFFDDNKVIIDTMESNSKSNERFDMKIYFKNINKSFGLECFEKHHWDKFDSDNRFEISRILNKNYCERDVRFIVIFWYGDILDSQKFNDKFKNIVMENFNLHNKTKKDYCIEHLSKSISNKKLCEIIYDSYNNIGEPVISINTINDNFIFTKNGKKKYLEHFMTDLENRYEYTNSNEYDIDLDLDSDSDSGSDSGSDSNSNLDLDSKKDFIKKYIYEKKLTFDGLSEYLMGLGYGNFLASQSDKFKVRDWFKNILFNLIKSFENGYDDLDKFTYEKNIFGLDNFAPNY